MEGGRTTAGEVKRVMVAIDENEESLYALEWALKNLYESIAKSQLVIFTAQPGDIAYIRVLETPRELRIDAAENQEQAALALLEKANDICRKYGGYRSWRSKDAIGDAVKKMNIQLLIVCHQGRGGANRVFLGSVSNYCVHHVKCPVLVVKKPVG